MNSNTVMLFYRRDFWRWFRKSTSVPMIPVYFACSRSKNGEGSELHKVLDGSTMKSMVSAFISHENQPLPILPSAWATCPALPTGQKLCGSPTTQGERRATKVKAYPQRMLSPWRSVQRILFSFLIGTFVSSWFVSLCISYADLRCPSHFLTILLYIQCHIQIMSIFDNAIQMAILHNFKAMIYMSLNVQVIIRPILW